MDGIVSMVWLGLEVLYGWDCKYGMVGIGGMVWMGL